MAYDDDADEVLLLSTATGVLLRYPKGLVGSPTVWTLPTAITFTGDVSMALAPDGKLWLADSGGATLSELTEDPAGGALLVSDTITHPTLTGPSAIAANNIGQVLVSDQGVILEFEKDPLTGWQAAADPLFTGLAAGGLFQVARSRSNFDPATMTGPAWRNVLPTEEEPSIEDAIPAVSEWGLVDMTLLVLTAGTLVYARRYPTRHAA